MPLPLLPVAPAWIGLGLALLAAGLLVAIALERVPEGEVGLLVVNGYVFRELDPGWHLVPPVIGELRLADFEERTFDVVATARSGGTGVRAEAVVTVRPTEARGTYDLDEQGLVRAARWALGHELGSAAVDELRDSTGWLEIDARRTLARQTREEPVEIEDVDVTNAVIGADVATGRPESAPQGY